MEQIQSAFIDLVLLLQKLSPGQLRGLCQFINPRSAADINFSLINDLIQRNSPQQLEQLIQASSKILHLDQQNLGDDKEKNELQQFAQIYHLHLLKKLLSDLNQAQWMKVFDLLVVTPGTQQVEQLQILGEIQQLLAQLHPETLQSLRSELEEMLKKEPQTNVLEALSQLIQLQSDHFYLYQPLSLLLQTPQMEDLLHLQEVIPRWEPIQLIQVTRLSDVGMFDAMNLKELLCGKELANNNIQMDIEDEEDDTEPAHTLQLQFIDQPPEKCVYKRNVKPPPVLMVSGEQGPNDGNLYIIVNLIRCDTFQEAPTLLTGNKPVKVTANRVIPFKKLKIMSTSHQLNETLFSLRFELRRYNGDEYETLHTITSDPICVLSHSTQLKQTNKDLPMVAEVVPVSGPPSGYTRVVVLGANFADSPTTRVKFDDIEVMPIFHGPKTLICHTPKHEPGTVKVTVCNDAKKWSDTAGTFTYDAAIEHEQDQEAVSLDQQFKLNIADSIWEAAFEGGFDSIRILTAPEKSNESNTNVDSPDDRGYTALHYSAAHGYDDITGLLLERNARLDLTDPRQGNTAMHWAAQNGHQSTIELMLKHEQSLLLRYLKSVRQNNRFGTCHFNSLINFQNYDGNSPLHLAAVEGQFDIVKTLVTAGAHVNMPNLDGLTPLHAAVQAGRADIAQFLIRNGAFVNQQDMEGDTPLHWAVRQGQYQMLNLLLDQGAGFDVKNSDAETPLLLAASINDDMMIRLLLAKGANVEAKDKQGLNALHWAAMLQNEAMAKLLLESSTKRRQFIMDQDRSGLSALGLAYMYGNQRIISAFLDVVGKPVNEVVVSKEDESCRSSMHKYHMLAANNGMQLVTPMYH
jgi:ankyrin repeat protein